MTSAVLPLGILLGLVIYTLGLGMVVAYRLVSRDHDDSMRVFVELQVIILVSCLLYSVEEVLLGPVSSWSPPRHLAGALFTFFTLLAAFSLLRAFALAGLVAMGRPLAGLQRSFNVVYLVLTASAMLAVVSEFLNLSEVSLARSFLMTWVNPAVDLIVLLVGVTAVATWFRYRQSGFLHKVIAEKLPSAWGPASLLMAFASALAWEILTTDSTELEIVQTFLLVVTLIWWGTWLASLGLALFRRGGTGALVRKDLTADFSLLNSLSPRETEVLERILEGEVLKVIASKLGVTTNTVKSHTQSIYRKSGVSTRLELVAKLNSSELSDRPDSSVWSKSGRGDAKTASS
jgi:DNA-binding CsgD family transcriptional regulator